MKENTSMKKLNASLTLLLASILIAAPKTAEVRTHYLIRSTDRHELRYYVTSIYSGGEDKSSELYLFRNDDGKQLRIEVERDYSRHLTTAEYSIDGQHSSKVRLDLPFTATTRSGYSAERKA